jgi:hypothetical protein
MHFLPYMQYGSFGGSFGFFAALLLLWSLAWKGWALWLAARRNEKAWFIILLILNTVGILEIIYIFAIAKQDDTKHKSETHGHITRHEDRPKAE